MPHHLQKTPLGFLGWLAAITLWMTWAPFTFRVGNAPELPLNPRFDLATASHLLLLVPIAIVLTTVRHGRGTRRSLVHLWGAVALWGLFLEVGQGWIENRGPSLYDMVANGLGAAFAIWGTSHLMRRGVGIRSIRVAVGVLVFTVIAGITVYSAFRINAVDRHFRLADWDPRFLVLSGDEVGEQRAYHGRVWQAQLCAGTPPQQVCIAPGASRMARLRLIESAEASQHVEMSAWVRSSRDRQRGRARIMTFSRGSALRNVTLAQRGRHLLFRIRTPLTGSDGSRLEFILRDAVPVGMDTRVVATFARGNVTIRAQHDRGIVSAAFNRAGIVPVMWRGRAAGVGAVILFASLGLPSALGRVKAPAFTGNPNEPLPVTPPGYGRGAKSESPEDQ